MKRLETCPTLPGRWLALRHAGSRRGMLYWLYLPPCPAPGGIALFVMLHGCDQGANIFAQGTRMNALAARRGFAVVYPQQSVSSHPQACWPWYERATQQGGGDAALVVGIVERVAASHPIDRRRIYACGFSAGGAMAHILALNHPGLFAGVGVHSGPLFGAARDAAGAVRVMLRGDERRVDSAIAEVLSRQPVFPQMPTILVHGEQDQVVRPVNQAQLERQALLLNRIPDGAPVEVAVHERSANAHAYQVRDVRLDGRLLLRALQVSGLRHAWSGGDERFVFNSAPGPDASTIMADFFLQHRRGVAAGECAAARPFAAK